MLKKVLKTVVYSLACAFMFLPVAVIFALSWWLITSNSWVSIGAGIIVAICGITWITVPIKTSYYTLREVWDPNFKFEFEIPIGG